MKALFDRGLHHTITFSADHLTEPGKVVQPMSPFNDGTTMTSDEQLPTGPTKSPSSVPRRSHPAGTRSC